MAYGRILTSLTLTGILLVFCSHAVLAGQQVFGARVCAGDDTVIEFCDTGVDVSSDFLVTGWDEAEVYASSGKRIVPESDGIRINKTGFYRVVFETTVLYSASAVEQSPDAAGNLVLRDSDDQFLGACGTAPAKAASLFEFAQGFFTTECIWSGTLKFEKGDVFKLYFVLGSEPGAPSSVQVRLDVSRL